MVLIWVGHYFKNLSEEADLLDKGCNEYFEEMDIFTNGGLYPPPEEWSSIGLLIIIIDYLWRQLCQPMI